MSNNYSSITSLISKIHSDTSTFLKKILCENGLSDLVSSHGFILYQLSENEQLTMSELSKKIHKDKSTTTALIKKLENHNYITKTQNPEDNRITYIKLSEEGKQYINKTNNISDLLTKTCCDNFTEDEKETLFLLLKRVSSNFNEALNKLNE